MHNPSPSLRPSLHYLATLTFIGFYGIQVCPFIESLTPLQLAIPLVLLISLQYLLRTITLPRLVEAGPYEGQVRRSFQLEWGLFVLSGFLLTAINSIFYDFPVGSGLKMVLGFTTLGFFVATDLALEKELHLAELLQRKGVTLTPDQHYFPLVGKFALFATLSIVFLIAIFFLLLSKDLEWLSQVGKTVPTAEAQHAILKEFAFVGSILLAYMLIVILSYARNLKHFLYNENSVLTAATAGNLNNNVTVSTNDEFGVMAHHTNIMIATLNQRNLELQKTRDVTILSLASLAETRDNETGAHILRTQRYVRALAIALRDHPRFQHTLDEQTIELLYKSAPLHDIGKVGIPDRILLKPGKLDAEEFEIMKTHASLGGEALERAEAELGGTSFLHFAHEIATSHHEKWDGSGYPRGLKGDEIPISGRLMAVADVYDALISKRIYKPAFPHEKAMEIIREGHGKHFDPDVVDALLAIEEEFKTIAVRYSDQAYTTETS
jgi:response regulator RpfG family c-di-GMP phosphodiesterase